MEVQRAEQLVRSTQAQLSSGHGNQDGLRKQLVKAPIKMQFFCCDDVFSSETAQTSATASTAHEEAVLSGPAPDDL